MRYASRLGKGRDRVRLKVNHRKLDDFVKPTPTDKKENGKKKKEKTKEAVKEE